MRSTTKSVKYTDSKVEGSATRANARAILDGHVMIHDDQHLFIAPVENVSTGGMFIQKLVSIPQGRQVKMVLKSKKLPVPVQMHGTVIRVEKNGKVGLAVRFTHLTDTTREVLETFVFESRMEAALKIA